MMDCIGLDGQCCSVVIVLAGAVVNDYIGGGTADTSLVQVVMEGSPPLSLCLGGSVEWCGCIGSRGEDKVGVREEGEEDCPKDVGVVVHESKEDMARLNGDV